jgi:hypothetical protein
MAESGNYGIMEGAYFVGRKELLDWLNGFLQLNYEKVEQVASGAAFCQLMDAMYPGSISLSAVNFDATLEYEFIQNFKQLQKAFANAGITKWIDIPKLTKAKYQDNLEFLQWMKRYFDGHYSKEEAYPALEKRQAAVKARRTRRMSVAGTGLASKGPSATPSKQSTVGKGVQSSTSVASQENNRGIASRMNRMSIGGLTAANRRLSVAAHFIESAQPTMKINSSNTYSSNDENSSSNLNSNDPQPGTEKPVETSAITAPPKPKRLAKRRATMANSKVLQAKTTLASESSNDAPDRSADNSNKSKNINNNNNNNLNLNRNEGVSLESKTEMTEIDNNDHMELENATTKSEGDNENNENGDIKSTNNNNNDNNLTNNNNNNTMKNIPASPQPFKAVARRRATPHAKKTKTGISSNSINMSPAPTTPKPSSTALATKSRVRPPTAVHSSTKGSFISSRIPKSAKNSVSGKSKNKVAVSNSLGTAAKENGVEKIEWLQEKLGKAVNGLVAEQRALTLKLHSIEALCRADPTNSEIVKSILRIISGEDVNNHINLNNNHDNDELNHDNEIINHENNENNEGNENNENNECNENSNEKRNNINNEDDEENSCLKQELVEEEQEEY